MQEGDAVHVRGTIAGFDDFGRPLVELSICDPDEYPTGGGLGALVFDRSDVSPRNQQGMEVARLRRELRDAHRLLAGIIHAAGGSLTVREKDVREAYNVISRKDDRARGTWEFYEENRK